MAASDQFLFVSHVSEDRAAAMEIVAELERRGVRCWIAPRDVHPGKPFDDEIADAIDASWAMLLIFSERCNESEYIRREVTVAGESQKVIIPFRIEDAQPRRGLRVRLSDLHWIDGFASQGRAIDELVKTFRAPADKADGTERTTQPQRPRRVEAGAAPTANEVHAPRSYRGLLGVLALVLLIVAGAVAAILRPWSTSKPDVAQVRTELPSEPPPSRIIPPARPPAPIEGGICANATTPAGIDQYCVSSMLKSDDSANIYSYGPSNLFDGAANTAWVEGVPGQGIGQWIVVAFDGLRLVKSITISNGYNKNPDIYQKNSRVMGLTVEFSGQNNSWSVVLKDTGTAQAVPLPGDAPVKAYWIKFIVESVYPGSKFQDTAISELRVVSDPAQP